MADCKVLNCPVCAFKAKKELQELYTYNIKCPICRTDNTIIDPKRILGLTDKCSICIHNNVEILFTSCYHCCVCLDCLVKM